MIAKIHRGLSLPSVDWIFRIVAIFSLMLGCWAILDTRSRTECQSQYNEANNRRTMALIGVTDDERKSSRRADDSLNAMFTFILVSGPRDGSRGTPEYQKEVSRLFSEVQQSYAQQSTDRVRADAARAANPPPPPPSSRC